MPRGEGYEVSTSLVEPDAVVGPSAEIDLGNRVWGLAQVREGARVGESCVVTKDVAPFSLVRGVPARQVGWVGRAGMPLNKNGEVLVCPVTGEIYEELAGSLRMKEQ